MEHANAVQCRTRQMQAAAPEAEGRTSGKSSPEGLDGRSREARLWWEYRRTGRTDLRNAVVELHMAWAERRTRAFARARGLDWRELWGAAAIGLIEAVERFDPSCGVPFRGYAAARITGALLDAGREALGGLPRAKKALEPHAAESGRGLGDRGSSLAGPQVAEVESRVPSPEPRCRTLEEPGVADGHLAADEYEGDGESAEGRRAAGPGASERLHSREPDPLSGAISNEIASDLFDAMAGARVREVARRRILLGETIDEIALAVGLGKSRVQEIIRRDVLPRARAVLARHGIVGGRRRPLRSARREGTGRS